MEKILGFVLSLSPLSLVAFLGRVDGLESRSLSVGWPSMCAALVLVLVLGFQKPMASSELIRRHPRKLLAGAGITVLLAGYHVAMRIRNDPLPGWMITAELIAYGLLSALVGAAVGYLACLAIDKLRK